MYHFHWKEFCRPRFPIQVSNVILNYAALCLTRLLLLNILSFLPECVSMFIFSFFFQVRIFRNTISGNEASRLVKTSKSQQIR